MFVPRSPTAQGSPVTFRQKVDGSNEYVEGSASNVNYNTAANLATLTGNARVKRGRELSTNCSRGWLPVWSNVMRPRPIAPT